jgi:hypothetical protein
LLGDRFDVRLGAVAHGEAGADPDDEPDVHTRNEVQIDRRPGACRY